MEQYEAKLDLVVKAKSGAVYLDAHIAWPTLDYAGIVLIQGATVQALQVCVSEGKAVVEAGKTVAAAA